MKREDRMDMKNPLTRSQQNRMIAGVCGGVPSGWAKSHHR